MAPPRRSCVSFVIIWLCTFVSLKFVGLRLEAPALWDLIFAGAATCVATIVTPKTETRGGSKDHLFGILCGVVFFAFLLIIYQPSGAVLPVHDPIAVPTIAKIISEGSFPASYYSPADLAYSYPPGYPIIFSYFVTLFGIRALTVFKDLNLAVLAAIPLAWAWQVRELFSPKIHSRWLFIGSYLAFFGLERTLSFALPGAGKNAMLLAALVTPLLLVTLFQLANDPKKWMAGGLVFFGGALLHYSIFYLVSTFFAGYVIYGILTRTIGYRNVAGLAFMGILGMLGFVLLFPEALQNPQTGELGIRISLERMQLVWAAIVAKYSVVLAIYNSQINNISGLAPSPYTGLVLAASVGFASLVTETRSLAVTYGLAILLSLLCGYGVIQLGLQLDIMRWYLWTFEAVALLAGILALLTFAATSPRIVYLIFICIITFGLVRLARDSVWVYMQQQPLTTDDLLKIPKIIDPILRPAQPCYLIGQSIDVYTSPLPGMIVQSRRDLDYLEYTTPCQFLNGSWVQGGALGGRELNGFPAVAVLRSASQSGLVMFVGTDTGLEDMKKSLWLNGYDVAAQLKGRTDEIGVWVLN